MLKIYIMTKADIVSNVSDKLGIDKNDVQSTIESFMYELSLIHI